MRRFDLRSLRFGDASEVWRRLPVEVDPFVYGGLDYEVPDGAVDLLLTAARVGDNITLSGRVRDRRSIGPCQRCLGDADVSVRGARRRVRAPRRVRGREEDEEGYVTSSIVDVERWVRDLIAEELPPKLLCRDDCRGLCAVCGADLNADPEHRHDEA